MFMGYNPREALLLGPPGATSQTLRKVAKSDPHSIRMVAQAAHSFPNNYIRVFFVENPGYQPGAIKCMQDAMKLGLFDGYDW